MKTKYFVVALLPDGRRAYVSCGKTWDVKSYTLKTAMKHGRDYSDRHQIQHILEKE